MKTATELFSAAFAQDRAKRSSAYRAGVLDGLRFVLGETGPIMQPPFRAGTAKSDAYFAGCAEGNRRGYDYLRGGDK